jgi:hypothetical protein
MTFDIPFDQPLDIRLHGYINCTREDPHGNSMPHVFLNPVTFLGTQEQHGRYFVPDVHFTVAPATGSLIDIL